MNRLGLYLSPTPDFTKAGFDRALWADREGFDDLWFPDGDGMRDAMTFAATVAGRTERVRLCTGITPVYTRVPAVIATTSSLAVNRVAPGRFALGLGSSTHTMVENWYGVPFERPLARVRETTELVRKLFAGEKTRYQGGHDHEPRLSAQGRRSSATCRSSSPAWGRRCWSSRASWRTG